MKNKKITLLIILLLLFQTYLKLEGRTSTARNKAIEAFSTDINSNSLNGEPNFTISTPNACINQYVKFTAIGEYENLYWTINGKEFPNNRQIETGFTFVANATYSVEMNYTVNGTLTKLSKTVEVSEFPNSGFKIQAAALTVCPNDPVRLTSTVELANYSWIIDEKVPLDQTNPIQIATFEKVGTYKIILFEKNGCGNSTPETLEITVSSSLAPDLSDLKIFPLTACPNSLVAYHVNTTGNILWEFGDGSKSNKANTTNRYGNEGIYTTTLSVKNGCGLSASKTVDIKIAKDNNGETPSIRVNEVDPSNANLTVKFSTNQKLQFSTGLNNPNFKVNWDFGDVETSNNINPTHTYTKEGTYTVTLYSENECGGKSKVTSTILINGSIYPTAYLQVFPKSICAGEYVYFYDNNNRNKDLKYSINIDGIDIVKDLSKTENDPFIYKVLIKELGQKKLVFTATNLAGNKIEINETIVVSDSKTAPIIKITNSSLKNAAASDQLTYTYQVDNSKTIFIGLNSFTANEISTTTKSSTGSYQIGTIGETPLDKIIVSEGTFKQAGNKITFYSQSIANCSSSLEYTFTNTNRLLSFAKATTPCKVVDDLLIGTNRVFLGTTPNERAVKIEYEYSDTKTTLSKLVLIPATADAFKYLMYTTDLSGANTKYVSSGIYTGDIKTQFNFDDKLACNNGKSNIYNSKLVGEGYSFTSVTSPCTAIPSFFIGKVFKNKINISPDIYYFKNGNKLTYVSLNSTKNEYKLVSGEENNTFAVVSSGPYSISGNILIFQFDKSSVCPNNGYYYFRYTVNQGIEFNVSKDDCPDRLSLLNNKEFERFYDNSSSAGVSQSVCLNETVDLEMIGGESYTWSDGTKQVGTSQKLAISFPAVGNYDITGTAKNKCGNETSIHTMIQVGDAVEIKNYFIVADFKLATTSDFVSFTSFTPNQKFGTNDKNSYKWDFGDNETSDLKSPKHRFRKDGEYDVSLTISNKCTKSLTVVYLLKVIKDKNTIKASFTFTTDGKTVTFKDESSGEPNEYMWVFGDGSEASISDSPTYTYTKAGIYNVSLTVKNTVSGLLDKISLPVKIEEESLLRASFSSNITENATQVYFQNTSLGSPSSYKWEFGDNTSSTLEKVNHIYANKGIYKVCLYVEDEAKLKSGFCKTIEVGDLTNTANFLFLNKNADGVVFTDKSEGKIDKWYWDFGDNQFSNLQTPTHKFAKNGIYNVCLTVIDNSSKSKSQSCQKVEISTTTSDLSAKFSYYKSNTPGEIIFINETNQPATNYAWNFGDGTNNTSTDEVVTHKYNYSNTYKVCLFVSADDKSDEFCQDVDLALDNETVSADFNYFIDNDKSTINVTDLSKGSIAKWYWTYGDGYFDNKQIPTEHTYTKSGIYNTCLQITEDKTNLIRSKCKSIVIAGDNSTINPNFSYSITANTVKSVDFKNKTIGEVKTYYWKFGDGGFATDAAPTYVYAKAGSYNVCLKVMDANGKISEFCDKVTILDESEPFVVDFDYAVDPTSLQIIVGNKSIGTINEWKWDFGDGGVASGKASTHTYREASVYSVCLSARNTSTGKFAKNCKSIAINKVNEININPLFSYFVDIEKKTITFKDETTGPVDKWYWNFEKGKTSNLQNPSLTNIKSGKYSVCLTAQNSGSKKVARYCEAIQVRATKDEAFVASDFEFLSDLKDPIASFKSTAKGSVDKWYWTFDDGTFHESETTSHTFARKGVYNVCLTASNKENKLYNTICKAVAVGGDACSVVADFSYLIEEDGTLSLSNKSKGNFETCFWDFGDGGSSTKWNTSYDYKKAGSYDVSMSISDKNKSCVDIVSEKIVIGSPACFANFNYNIDATTKTVNFTNLSNGEALSSSWSFDDGKYSSDLSPSHIFVKNGAYTINLKIKSNTCTDNIQKEIQIGQVECAADFNYYTDSLTKTTYLMPKALGNTKSFYWDFGDGGNSILENPNHIYQASGFYDVSLTTKNADGTCMDHKETSLLITNSKNTINTDFNYIVDADGITVYFENTSKGAISKYIWTFGDKTDATIETPGAHTYAANGIYNVCLTSTSELTKRTYNTCKDIRVAKADDVILRSNFFFDADVNTKKANFVNNSLGNPTSYLWDFGDGKTSTIENPSHVYAVEGQYFVSLTLNNKAGKTNAVSGQVVNMTKKDNFAGLFKFFTDGSKKKTRGTPVDLMGAAHGKPALKVWDFGDGKKDSTSLEPNHVYENPGTYIVTFTVTDPVTGKTATSTQTIVITDIEDNLVLDSDVNVYPNPNNGKFKLNVNGQTVRNYLIEIVNVQSQVVFTDIEKNTSAFTKELDVELKAGVYFLRLQAENKFKIIKIIVQ